jgi:hypothetical protein
MSLPIILTAKKFTYQIMLIPQQNIQTAFFAVLKDKVFLLRTSFMLKIGNLYFYVNLNNKLA